MSQQAIVRTELEKLDFVTRTWIEWRSDKNGFANELIIEVNFDTDPNRESVQWYLDEIDKCARETLTTKTAMGVHGLRVVPAKPT